LTGKAVSWDSTLAPFVRAEEGLVTVAVETVCLALVAQEASSGRESSALAGIRLAAIRLEVRVDKFAGQQSVFSTNVSRRGKRSYS